MTSSNFKSEITSELCEIELIGAPHTKPHHFLHLLRYLKNFGIDVMTSSKLKSDITGEP